MYTVFVGFIYYLNHWEVEIVSDIKRKKGESFEGFMRRVKQQWQRSGKLLEARKGQYFEKKANKGSKRKQALAKLKTSTKLAYLKKTGKLSAKEEKYFTKRNKS